jgi:type II secretion system protein H
MGRRPEIARGFTLLEVIVTLAVLALAAAVVTPAIGRSTEGLRARADVAGFAATLRHAREQAITSRRMFRVVVDADGHTISIAALPGQEPTPIAPPTSRSAPSGGRASSSRDPSRTSDPLAVERKPDAAETRAISPRLTIEALQGTEVLFDTRGSASGGDFKLTASGAVYRVTVDRLTGRVRSTRE